MCHSTYPSAGGSQHGHVLSGRHVSTFSVHISADRKNNREGSPLHSAVQRTFPLVPSGVEISPQFYWGKKNSFSMSKTSYCGILVKVWRPHYQSNRRFYAIKKRRKKRNKEHVTFKIPLSVLHRICNGIFNHTSLCEFHQGKLLLHLTIPFEEKPKTNLPSDNLKYYRQRKQMATRQLAEKLDSGVYPKPTGGGLCRGSDQHQRICRPVYG